MEKSSTPLLLYLNDFLDWLEIEKGLRSKSQENYARFIKRFFDWLKQNSLENLKPHELTPEHIWQYRAHLARAIVLNKPYNHTEPQKTLKKSTQNYYLIALRALLNFFADRDILALPSEKIKLPKEKDGKIVNFLDLGDLEKLFSAPDISTIQGLRDRAILEVFFSTGTRIAELLGLNREQIKMPLVGEPEELEIVIVGKGGRPRTVYFSDRSLGWLKKYLEKRIDTNKALFVNHNTTKVDSNTRLTHRTVQKNIKKYAIMAGLPLTTTPHVMRHSFATDLLNQGVDFRILQEFLGHKSPLATQIYAHVTSKKLRDIHQKFHSGKNLKNG
ncbi:MAG: tyrosine-type recombinase/integrase [Candidatus Pacebacteria bacterium]|nr:tyrosine-type recombinase/integrase [Candidatus Paceibacterota bacterium]